MMDPNRIRDIDFWRLAVPIRDPGGSYPGQPARKFDSEKLRAVGQRRGVHFLPGLSIGLIDVPRADKYGLEPVAGGLLRRALKIYGVHIALTVAALLVFGPAYWRLAVRGVPDLIEAHGRSYVFGCLFSSGLIVLALMSLQLGYFNILPLYVVLMLWTPVALAIARQDPLAALIVSAGLYAAARVYGLNLPNWPEAGGWFFNPIAWQLGLRLAWSRRFYGATVRRGRARGS